MGLSMSVERITPEKAGEYLRKNTDNYRTLSKSRARAFAADIAAGVWELNGEPIVFSASGVLKDGQHRLAAVIYSGKAVDMAVIRGVSDNVSLYDIGALRSSGQIAKAIGVDLPAQAVATARIIVNRFRPAPKGLVIRYAERNYGELARAYRVSCHGSGVTSKKTSLVVATYLMLRTESTRSYEAELFFKVFNSGKSVGTDGYDPSSALVARRMFDERFQRQQSVVALKEQIEILVLAMRDFAKGVHREKNYKIEQPFRFDELITSIRKEDGLE